MRREQRLTRSSDFARVYDQGRSWANKLLVMRAFPAECGRTRIGFSVSKRVGNAVVRNRVKRVLREVVRLSSWEAGWDVVFIARAGTSVCNFDDIRRAVDDLAGRSKMRKQD